MLWSDRGQPLRRGAWLQPWPLRASSALTDRWGHRGPRQAVRSPGPTWSGHGKRDHPPPSVPRRFAGSLLPSLAGCGGRSQKRRVLGPSPTVLQLAESRPTPGPRLPGLQEGPSPWRPHWGCNSPVKVDEHRSTSPVPLGLRSKLAPTAWPRRA